jgi:hypothetical protein
VIAASISAQIFDFLFILIYSPNSRQLMLLNQLLVKAASTDGPNAYAVTAIPPVITANTNAQILGFLLMFLL